ncbi:MAG: efflux RND transporter periplasmic adaptor subunit [Opitutaceae bacterium]|nr:efflux RND transporter periplasmic adaptor subunit [Opitutaceae bacterium]
MPRPESESVRRAARATLFITVLGAALLAAGGCARQGRDGGEPLAVHGNLETDDARLSFKVAGRLIERAVDEGQRVQAGAPIGRLDDTELTQELAVRRAEAGMAAAALAELEAGTRPEEIAAMEATLRSAEADRERARAEYARQEALRAANVNAERELEIARATARATEARVVELGQRLALLRAGPRRETIEQARARLEQARAAVALAETRVANAVLTAPSAGVVLAKHAEPGEFLGVGAPVVTVTDHSHIWLRGYVNQLDLDYLRLGQTVEVAVDAFPGRAFQGRLAFISPEAEFTPKTVQTEKERVTYVFRIRIDLDNTSGELKAGMAAKATLPAPSPTPAAGTN